MTKLGIDELQHHKMKAKTDPSNVYSSIRILPDLVRFQGYIRIHRCHGNIVCPVPQKIAVIVEATEEKKDDARDHEMQLQSEVSNETMEGKG
eukprot:CAMPEP_0197066986 /NCGR_PEP_ID=MMETSP1384-20130603/177297_1 /TAXON_ID=29189 /ORGANISM="Ammonia sp." /LENGTH=91 /DNA_ID=CAMNT_0042504317 /DNA_START=1 /DNA_END=272 /DNA_ORIENTATION=-